MTKSLSVFEEELLLKAKNRSRQRCETVRMLKRDAAIDDRAPIRFDILDPNIHQVEAKAKVRQLKPDQILKMLPGYGFHDRSVPGGSVFRFIEKGGKLFRSVFRQFIEDGGLRDCGTSLKFAVPNYPAVIGLFRDVSHARPTATYARCSDTWESVNQEVFGLECALEGESCVNFGLPVGPRLVDCRLGLQPVGRVLALLRKRLNKFAGFERRSDEANRTSRCSRNSKRAEERHAPLLLRLSPVVSWVNGRNV